MQKAILKVVKSSSISNFPGGTLASVNLFCSGVKADIENVFINSSFVESQVPGTGKIYVVKISCGGSTTYALGNKADLIDLQLCCNTVKNLTLSLACPAVPPLNVYSITGALLGTATTQLQYVNLWNGDTNNQTLGKLYTGNNWKFNLSFNVGNFRPFTLECAALTATCPAVSFTNVTSNSVTVNWVAVPGATNYHIEVIREGQTSGFANATTSSLTANFSSLQPGSLHHVTVTPEVDGAYLPTCPAVDFSTTSAPVVLTSLKWGHSLTDPYVDNTTAPVYSLLGSLDPLSPGATLSTNFTSMPSQRYAVVEYPATESDKTIWADSGSAPNNGSIPDAAFRAIFAVNGRKYIVSRNPMDFDTNPASRVVFS